MTTKSLSINQEQENIRNLGKQYLSFEMAQEKIYRFFLEIVRNWKPEDVLNEFKCLFIDTIDVFNSNFSSGIYEIFIESTEDEFHNTFKRCCYILINNWETSRKYQYIQKLISLLENLHENIKLTSSRPKSRYKVWLENFLASNDYEELKLFAYKHEESVQQHWTKRYRSYLLTAQSLNKKNPKEQQEVAHKISRQLKDKFKFELAMYSAHSETALAKTNRYKNPSTLGDEVVRLIKRIIVKNGVFNYKNIANIFVKQTENQTFKQFKESIQKYLIFSVDQQEVVETLKQDLSDKILSFLVDYDKQTVSKDLLLRTSNRIIDLLTTENGREPSALFTLLVLQGNSLTLVIVLLKIILICKNSRSHLELRIANLIGYYDKYPAEECRWFINFIEILNIMLAIYADNIEYNLINMEENQQYRNPQLDLHAYRVFSQSK
ncbi:hypothetical protein G7B40_015290 [Aetokthonos hydrillicola Thurmond2011]|jgi:hypothetical protein|uniref:Uncharacterized protein n=1 Tax=Aetokthonos hydrillicola Thurmond2011 TaxID=2712845 RepID=A0AAP5I992_9CYAN|nr:hypothetical protein [Aetokthonos hydrillicola]MBO3461638.1 hypothetical protein [Aetokthonos hydrillicola CCALA 1050]MBW4588749.1 hypothetical protein [Aetokthonos hydrillicola CCALA 1050]MDR9895917.1 hypothetical protein [Aetokthonos hydrillicola Thurmond2011]